MADNTGLIVGGIIAVGGIGFGVYQWYQSGERAKAAKKLADDVNAYMALAAQHDALQDQYELELNQIIAKLNNAVASGGQMTPEQEADLEAEKQHAVELEAQIVDIEKQMEDLEKIIAADAAKAGQSVPALPGFTDTVNKLLLWGLIKAAEVGGVYFVGKYVYRVIDRWTKGGGTGGASGTRGTRCPVDGASVSGNSTDEVEANMEAHFRLYHPVVNVNAMVAALPEARAKFGELPLWVQDAIAADAGIEWYLYPDWSPYLRQSPDSLFAIMVSLAVLAACFYIALPLLPAAVGTVPGTMEGMAGVLVPAFG